MKPVDTSREMLNAHEQMFGTAGRQCAEVVLHWADKLFDVPLDALNIRVVLAPVELGPYNRHAGYHFAGEGAFILGNRHVVKLKNGSIELTEQGSGYVDNSKTSWFTSSRMLGKANCCVQIRSGK